MRNLTEKEITILTNQGCIAEDWSTIQVKDGFTPQYINNVEFYGQVTLGVFQKDVEVAPGFSKHSGILINTGCLFDHIFKSFFRSLWSILLSLFRNLFCTLPRLLQHMEHL